MIIITKRSITGRKRGDMARNGVEAEAKFRLSLSGIEVVGGWIR